MSWRKVQATFGVCRRDRDCRRLAGDRTGIHFSDTWQLVMNTLTSVVTFLMVFLIQTSQNRDSTALQAKLDELIRASSAKNLFVGLEHLSPDEIEEIRQQVHGHLQRKANAGGI
jgi:low affinity Fe/Cu permease